MAVPTEMQDTLTGMIFEIAIFVLFLALLLLMWRHYRLRKTRYTLLMFYVFVLFTAALLFSWISKAINLYLVAPTFDDVDPNMPGFLFISRILQFRVSFAFITLAIYVTQLFRVAVFETPNARIQNIIIGIFSLLTMLYSLIVVVQGQVIYDVLAFLLVLIDLIAVFVPFAIASLNMRKIMTDPIYKKASTSLAVMAFAFIFIFVGFLTDRILIMTIRPDGYTFFYYAAWISAILGSVAAYLGYIRPGQKQKLQEVANAAETTVEKQ
ncbi:MAG: hypothetical protein ACTSRK_18410 [Promethearchaeota archaeon]